MSCEECIGILEALGSASINGAGFLRTRARAHLAVHANRTEVLGPDSQGYTYEILGPIREPETCEECGGSGKLPPITHERLVALLMDYPDASEAGIATLLSGAPCPCQGVK
jgi:hypothetical protein